MDIFGTTLLATVFLSAATGTRAYAAYAGNVTVVGSGTCSMISGTFPARVSYLTSSTEAVYYITFTVPLPAPAPPEFLVVTLVSLNGSPNTSFAADPELFGTLGELNGGWNGPIVINSNQLNLGTNLALQRNGSTTGTPVTVAVAFNGGTCGLNYTGETFNEN